MTQRPSITALRPYTTWLLPLAIVAITVISLWPSLSNDFTNWDDHEYVTENPWIRAWSGENLRAIWTQSRAANYHPLVFMTHLVEHSLWGLTPRGYHAVNLALHVITTLFVFRFLAALGISRNAAALAAAWFGVHPMHVESVAWIAERKDVLCGALYMLALERYVRAARRPVPRFPWTALAFYILALLSKPMAITWPIITVLCDWLLRRKLSRRWWIEKAVIVLPAVALITVTVLVQADKRGIQPEVVRIGRNVLFACRAYGFYLGKLLWPARLCAFYPRSSWPHALPFPLAIAGGLAVLTAGVSLAWRRWPIAVFAAGWYTVVLLPVSGVIPIGFVFAADRYMYLPSVAPLLLAALALTALGDRFRALREGLAVLVTVSLVACATLAWQRCAVWKSGVTLWTDTVAKAPNHLTWRMLAMAQMEKGRLLEAERSMEKSFEFSETQWGRHYYAEILRLQGRNAEAVEWYSKFIAEQDWYLPARFGCGQALMALGRHAEAAVMFAHCVNVEQGSAENWAHLGWALMEQGDKDQADLSFRNALALDPRNVTANYNLGVLHMWQNNHMAACDLFRRVLADAPGHRFALVNLGVCLGHAGLADEARAVLQQAVAAYPDDAIARRELESLSHRPE